MADEEADRSLTEELTEAQANRAYLEAVLASDWDRAGTIAAAPPADATIADLQRWRLRQQSLADRQWESFLVRYGEGPNARHVVLRAPTAIEARAVAATYWDAWPSELEVWTTLYYTQRYDGLPKGLTAI